MAAADAHSEAERPPTPGYHPLVIALIAAAAGMVVDRYRPLPVAAWWAIAAACLGGWFMLRANGGRGRGGRAFPGRIGFGRVLAPLPLEPVRQQRPGPLRPYAATAGLH